MATNLKYAIIRSNNLRLVASTAIVFTLIIYFVIIVSSAILPHIAIEAENGTLGTGATKVADSTASGGSYLNLGSLQPPSVTWDGYKNTILATMTGYAKDAGTTGGLLASSPLVVTSASNSGTGTLRDMVARAAGNPAWIIFDPAVFPKSGSVKINLTSDISLPSNLTIDGSGANVTVMSDTQHRLEIGSWSSASSAKQNIIIHNIKIGPSPSSVAQTGDGLAILNNSDKIWIDHVEFIGPFGDEALSILHPASTSPKGQMRATFSSLYFHDLDASVYPTMDNKGLLVGNGNNESRDGIWDTASNPIPPIKVSLYDSYFNNVNQRNPQIIDTQVHMCNTYVKAYNKKQTSDSTAAIPISGLGRLIIEHSVTDSTGSNTRGNGMSIRTPYVYVNNVTHISNGQTNAYSTLSTNLPAATSPTFTRPSNACYSITSASALLSELTSATNPKKAGILDKPSFIN